MSAPVIVFGAGRTGRGLVPLLLDPATVLARYGELPADHALSRAVVSAMSEEGVVS